jgi:hypothetical protein
MPEWVVEEDQSTLTVRHPPRWAIRRFGGYAAVIGGLGAALALALLLGGLQPPWQIVVFPFFIVVVLLILAASIIRGNSRTEMVVDRERRTVWSDGRRIVAEWDGTPEVAIGALDLVDSESGKSHTKFFLLVAGARVVSSSSMIEVDAVATAVGRFLGVTLGWTDLGQTMS